MTSICGYLSPNVGGTRRIFRWMVTIVVVLLLIPIISEFAIEFAREQGVYDRPTQKVNSGVAWAIGLTSQWWFIVSLSAAVGASGALWSDYWLRRWWPDSSKAATDEFFYETLASDCLGMSRKIKKLLCTFASARRYPEHTQFPQMTAILISLQKAGFMVPDLERGATREGYARLDAYLALIGELLSKNHVEEAKEASKSLAADVEANLGGPLSRR